MISGALVAISCAGAALIPGAARAETEVREAQVEQARVYFERGKTLYGAGDYTKAVQEYLAAYRIASFPELVFNIGQAHRLANNHGEALRAYEMYLQQASSGALADEARAHVLELRNRGVAPSTEPLDKTGWNAFTSGLETRSATRLNTERVALVTRRSRFVIGADITRTTFADNPNSGHLNGETGGAFTTLSASGGYYYRLRRGVVLEPRLLLGIALGEGEEGSLGAAYGNAVSLDSQVRILVVPTPSFFAGVGVGLGLGTCAGVDLARAPIGQSQPISCQVGLMYSTFVEAGLLLRDRYEVSLTLHPFGAMGKEIFGMRDPVTGLSFAYHL